MNLKRINKKITDKELKIRYSMEKLMRNTDSPIFCDKCKNRLGILYMIKHSFRRKKGEKYLVPCKSCKIINVRVKGEIGKKIDSDWEQYEMG